jgi:hypothetical protein
MGGGLAASSIAVLIRNLPSGATAYDAADAEPVVRVSNSGTATPGSLNAVVCTRIRELQEALSAATIALEISSRNSRVAALQKR